MAEPLTKAGPGPPTARRAAVEAWLARSGSQLAARVRTVRELAALAVPVEPALWSTALPAIARLLPAGLPRGELIEVVGRRSSGRLALALGLLAAATGTGESAALVDLGDAFDPRDGAAEGIDLARLLWARPEHLKPALIAVESLIGGGFPLIVLELGLPPVPGGRGAEAHWLRLARAAREARALVVVSAPYRVTGVATPLIFELTGARGRWRGTGCEPRLLDGVDSRLDRPDGHSLHTGGAPALALALSAV